MWHICKYIKNSQTRLFVPTTVMLGKNKQRPDRKISCGDWGKLSLYAGFIAAPRIITVRTALLKETNTLRRKNVQRTDRYDSCKMEICYNATTSLLFSLLVDSFVCMTTQQQVIMVVCAQFLTLKRT